MHHPVIFQLLLDNDSDSDKDNNKDKQDGQDEASC